MSTTRIRNVCVLGERVSGTSFLQKLITENTKLISVLPFGHKHFFQDVKLIRKTDTKETLFVFIFRIVRGEMDEHIFRTLMGLKKKVDDGELTNERAKEMVIDSAKQQVDGEVPRMQRVKKEGGTVQEINLKCRVEDGLTQVSDNKS